MLKLKEDYWLKIPVILYTIGFIVHNVYLSQFGSHEFELIQAKYILSGFGLIGFSAVCFAFTSIRVNLSYIPDTFSSLTKVLPWLLRVVSLPYVIYWVLYPENFKFDPEHAELFETSFFFIKNIAIFVVFFSINDLVFMLSDGDVVSARIIRGLFSFLAIPMVIVTFIFIAFDSIFSGIFQTTIFFFIGFIGVALRQADNKHGIEVNELDKNSETSHKQQFSILVGIIAVFLMMWFMVSNYSEHIYPRIPVALGGAKLVHAKLVLKDRTIDSYIIQETDTWIIFKNNETKVTEKIKTEFIDEVIFINNETKDQKSLTEKSD